MGVETRTLIWRGKDELTDVTTKVRKGIISTGEAGFTAGGVILKAFGTMGEEGKRLEPLVDKIGQKFSDLAEFADEGAQKIIDAQKKLSEFGGSVEDLAAGFEASVNAANKWGVSITRTSAALEELAIRTEDPKQAIQLLDRAMQLAIRTNAKAEDAADGLAQAYKGNTAALKELSGRGERYAKQLDNIKDPLKRAKETVRLLNKELDSQPSLLDRASDRFAILRTRASEVAGGVDILGIGLKGAAGAVLAFGAAAAAASVKVVQFGIEASKTFLEATPQGRQELELLDRAVREFTISTGEAVNGNINLGQTVQDASILVKFMATDVRALGAELQGVTSFVASGAKAWFNFNDTINRATGDLLGTSAAMKGLNSQLSEFFLKTKTNIEASRKFQAQQRSGVDDIAVREIKSLQQKIALGKELLTQEERLFVQRAGGEKAGFFVGAFEDRAKAAKLEQARLDKDATSNNRRLKAGVASSRKALKEKQDSTIDFGIQEENFQNKLFDRQAARRAAFNASIVDGVAKMNDEIKRLAGQAAQESADILTKVRGGTVDKTPTAGEALAAQRLLAEGGASSAENAKMQVDAAVAGADRLTIKMIEVTGASKELASVAASAFANTTAAIGNGIANMTQQMVEGTFSLKALTANLLGGLGDIMVTTGGQLVLMGTLTLNGAQVASGLALMAAGGALKGVSTKAAGGGAGAPSGGGSVAGVDSSRRGDSARAENDQASLERRFPSERSQRAEKKREARETAAEDEARAKFREQTFLAAVDKTLAADRERNREAREIFQTFEGRIAQSSANVDSQVLASNQRLQRTHQLVGVNGYPLGLSTRR